MTHYQFGGPIGAGLIMLGLPFFVWSVEFIATHNDWSVWPLPVPTLADVANTWSWTAWWVVCGWMLWITTLYYVIPGDIKSGVELPNGKRLRYPMNAWGTFVLTVCGLVPMHFRLVSLTWVADHIPQLAMAAIAFAGLLSTYLYISSFAGKKLLAEHGTSGNAVYDFYMGRELNPRILAGTLDLKFMQYELHGTVTASMILVNVFQLYYVLDGLWFEPCILTTMDITTDGFGFMLAFGDLVWVPFTYTLQARYLVDYPVDLSWLAIIAIVTLKLLGMYIFRSANFQKDRFRGSPTHPANKHLKYIQTKRGTKLLADGWWGMSRHVNYLGDWLMGWAWCLPTGFGTILTYFYVAYFGALLVHRERRDENKCADKYGEDWQKYKQLVPYRIIPGVY